MTDPGFPRRSTLIDYVLGLGERGRPAPGGEHADRRPSSAMFNLWVLLGAQYR